MLRTYQRGFFILFFELVEKHDKPVDIVKTNVLVYNNLV